MTRRTKLLSLVAVAVVGLVLLRTLVSGVEDWMRESHDRLPPQWQIRWQAEQLAHDVVVDHEVGFLLPANEDMSVETLDFAFRRRSDDFGFPNPSPWPGTADIVFLGDSLLLGEGVGIDASFTALIDEMLEDDSVINLGNPGAGVDRQYLMHRRFGAPLEPDLVIASLYLAADLTNDRHFRAWIEDSAGLEYNRFRLTYRRRTETRSFFDISRRLQGHPLFGWVQSLVEPRLPGSFRHLHEFETSDGSRYFFSRDYTEFANAPGDDFASELAALTDSLTRLRYLVEIAGDGTLAVMLIPAKEELFAINDDVAQIGVKELVVQHLTEMELPFLDLYPILQSRGVDSSVYYQRDIHLNALGNQLIAEAFVDWRSAADLDGSR